MPQKPGDAVHFLGPVWQGLGLRILHHLQAMFDLAVLGVMRGQLFGHVRGTQPLSASAASPSTVRGLRRSGSRPPGDKLAGLGEELDLADAALPQFQVMPVQAQRTAKPLVRLDAQAHVMRVLNGGKIQVTAPDEGAQACPETARPAARSPAQGRALI